MKRVILVSLLAGIFDAASVYAQMPTADQTVGAARVAAREDRHVEAIDAFRRAIALAPERRGEWLIELADQLTWSGKLDESIKLYREAAATGDHDARRRAMIGLARALSWDNRQRESLAVYRQTLVDYPDDIELRRGLGRVTSWRGRLREAAGQMQELLEDQPHDREATKILAESLIWMGRPDSAERVLRDQISADPKDQEATSLLDDLEFRQRPEGRIDWRESEQSDKLRINELAMNLRFALENGRGYLGPRYTHAAFRPAQGPVEQITVQRPAIAGGYRLSDMWDVNAAAALDIIKTQGATGDHRLPTFEAYTTYRPDDVLRFDFGTSRWTFDSEETLREGLTATQVASSFDVAPNERMLFSARYSVADYSDGNERRWWQAQANHRLLNRPRIIVGYRYTGFTFKTPGQGGYYNPDEYRTHELMLSGSGQLGRRLRWDARLIGGDETETPGGSRYTVNGGVSLTRHFSRWTELELAFDHSSSRTFAVGGFERNIARLTLHQRF